MAAHQHPSARWVGAPTPFSEALPLPNTAKKFPAKVPPFHGACVAHSLFGRSSSLAGGVFIQSCCRVLYRSPLEARNMTILTTMTTEIICESAPPRRTSGVGIGIGTVASPWTVRLRREIAAGAGAAVALHLPVTSASSLHARPRRSRTRPASSTAVGRLAVAAEQAPR